MKKAEVKRLFAQAKLEKDNLGGGFEKVRLPAGRYTARLKAKFWMNDNGEPHVIHDWTVVEGEFKGKTPSDFRKLSTAKALAFTMKTWDEMGFESEGIEDMEQLADFCEFISKKGAVCVIKVVDTDATDKQGNPYQNFYVDSLVGYSDEEKAPEVDDGDDDEEDDEDADIDVGTLIKFTYNDKTYTKPVLDLDEDEGAIIVKVGKAKVSITLDDVIEVLTDDDE